MTYRADLRVTVHGHDIDVMCERYTVEQPARQPAFSVEVATHSNVLLQADYVPRDEVPEVVATAIRRLLALEAD